MAAKQKRINAVPENIFSSLNPVHLRILKVVFLSRPRWVKTKEFDGKVGVSTRSAILKKTRDLVDLGIVIQQYEPNTEERSRRPYIYKIASAHIDSVGLLVEDVCLLNQESQQPTPSKATSFLVTLKKELESAELELKGHQKSLCKLQEMIGAKQSAISRIEAIIEAQKVLIQNYEENSPKI